MLMKAVVAGLAGSGWSIACLIASITSAIPADLTQARVTSPSDPLHARTFALYSPAVHNRVFTR
jgi:hypothetical protein